MRNEYGGNQVTDAEIPKALKKLSKQDKLILIDFLEALVMSQSEQTQFSCCQDSTRSAIQ